jgi:hypothetical protein
MGKGEEGYRARDNSSQGLEGLLGVAPLGIEPEDRLFVREPLLLILLGYQNTNY